MIKIILRFFPAQIPTPMIGWEDIMMVELSTVIGSRRNRVISDRHTIGAGGKWDVSYEYILYFGLSYLFLYEHIFFTCLNVLSIVILIVFAIAYAY